MEDGKEEGAGFAMFTINKDEFSSRAKRALRTWRAGVIIQKAQNAATGTQERRKSSVRCGVVRCSVVRCFEHKTTASTESGCAEKQNASQGLDRVSGYGGGEVTGRPVDRNSGGGG